MIHCFDEIFDLNEPILSNRGMKFKYKFLFLVCLLLFYVQESLARTVGKARALRQSGPCRACRQYISTTIRRILIFIGLRNGADRRGKNRRKTL